MENKFKELSGELISKTKELAHQNTLKKEQDLLYLKACRDIFNYIQGISDNLNGLAMSFSLDSNLLQLSDSWTIGFNQKPWMVRGQCAKVSWWICTCYGCCVPSSYYSYIDTLITDELLLEHSMRKNMDVLIYNWDELKSIINSSLEQELLKRIDTVREQISNTSASIKYLEDFTV